MVMFCQIFLAHAYYSVTNFTIEAFFLVTLQVFEVGGCRRSFLNVLPKVYTRAAPKLRKT